MSLYISVCLSLCKSVCLCCLSLCMSLFVCLCVSLYVSVCLSPHAESMTSFAASCPPGGRLQTAGQDARNRPSPRVSPRDGRLDSGGNKREGTIVKHSIFNQIERCVEGKNVGWSAWKLVFHEVPLFSRMSCDFLNTVRTTLSNVLIQRKEKGIVAQIVSHLAVYSCPMVNYQLESPSTRKPPWAWWTRFCSCMALLDDPLTKQIQRWVLWLEAYGCDIAILKMIGSVWLWYSNPENDWKHMVVI